MAVNIFVGVLNMLPMLPLDGGYVAIATYERLRSRRGRALPGRRQQAGAGHLRLHGRAACALRLHALPGHRPPDRQPLRLDCFGSSPDTAEWWEWTSPPAP